MKICVFGAGAIGGHVAARLIADGSHQISIIARGPHLDAIRTHGLFLETEGELVGGRPYHATDNSSEIQPQDLIIVALKAHGIRNVAKDIARLSNGSAPVLFLVNGIPWWWSHGLEHTPAANLVDPQRDIWNEIGPEVATGCVVYSSNNIRQPGIVQHVYANRWILGEPSGIETDRINLVHALFNKAGLAADTTTDIRRCIWEKVLLNASTNPLSALTRLPVPTLFQVEGVGSLRNALMSEIALIAHTSGSAIPETVLQDAGRASGPERVVYPSMLQDVLLGRSIEVEALIGQPHAIGRWYGLETPALDVVVPLARALNSKLLSDSIGRPS